MPLDPDFESAIRRFMTEGVRFNSFLGIQIRDLDLGFARMAIPFREELMGDPLRPALHGGVISALMDVVGGTALLTQLAPGERLSTVDLRIDYLRPAGKVELVSEGTVLRVGGRVGVVRIQTFSGPERIHVAEGTGVYQLKRKRGLDHPEVED